MFRIILRKNKSLFSYSTDLSNEFKEFLKSVKTRQYNNNRWEMPIEEFEKFEKFLSLAPQIVTEEDKATVVLKHDNHLCFVKFNYNREIIDIIKQIKGKRYIVETKTWVIPFEERATLINRLQPLDVIISSEV